MTANLTVNRSDVSTFVITPSPNLLWITTIPTRGVTLAFASAFGAGFGTNVGGSVAAVAGFAGDLEAVRVFGAGSGI